MRTQKYSLVKIANAQYMLLVSSIDGFMIPIESWGVENARKVGLVAVQNFLIEESVYVLLQSILLNDFRFETDCLVALAQNIQNAIRRFGGHEWFIVEIRR